MGECKGICGNGHEIDGGNIMDDQIKKMLIFIAMKIGLGALKVAGTVLVIILLLKLFGVV